MFGDPVGDVGRDQRQRDLDLRIACAMPGAERKPTDGGAEQQFDDDDGRERAGRLRQREHAGRNRYHCEAIEDQRGGVVGEAFAFQHDENPARHAELAGDRQRRHHVGRCDDGPQQEADAPGQADQVMRGGRDRAGGEDHAADRQQDDRSEVGSEFAPTHGDAGRIDQRRQHHQQHQFGRQLQRRHSRHEGQRDAGEQQQDGGRDVESPRHQGGARQHGEQDQEDLKFGFHDGSHSQANTCNRQTPARSAPRMDAERSGFKSTVRLATGPRSRSRPGKSMSTSFVPGRGRLVQGNPGRGAVAAGAALRKQRRLSTRSNRGGRSDRTSRRSSSRRTVSSPPDSR